MSLTPVGVGPVSSAFTAALYDVFESLRLQFIANSEIIVEREIQEILEDILSDTFTQLIAQITQASGASMFSLSGSENLPNFEKELGGKGFSFDVYQYPALSSYWMGIKQEAGYTNEAPFKGIRHLNSDKGSLINGFNLLRKDRNLGENLLRAFGHYQPEFEVIDQEDYLSDFYRNKKIDVQTWQKFKAQAEKKRAEIAAKKKVAV